MAFGDQFGRKINLFLINQKDVLDLSNMKIRFSVQAADAETPNTAVIRVYNLSSNTLQTLNEYNQVILEAGYENGNYGQIFIGTIKQYIRGKETNVDSFLDIMAADGDLGFNFGVINKSLSASVNGVSAGQQLTAIAQSMDIPIDESAEATLYGGFLPRGKVLFGMSRDVMRDLATSSAARWSILNGILTLIPNDGYLPGDIIDVNSKTGMIGTPAATDNGITVRVLLNPLIKCGRRIRINNKDINETIIRQQGFPQAKTFNAVASVSDDGMYRVLVVEHEGDTRGVDWYTNLICVTLDQNATNTKNPIPFFVDPFG